MCMHVNLKFACILKTAGVDMSQAYAMLYSEEIKFVALTTVN